MPHLTLEQRVAALEQEVAEIKAQQRNGAAEKDWRRTVGMFPGLQEVFAEAMKIREADRRKARQQGGKGRPVKS
jgi:hypothetical protein